MGKKDKNKKKGKGAEKTAMKTDKKLAAKQKRMLEKLGETDIAEVVAKLEAEELRLKEVTEVVCAPPTPRSNFTIVAHPEKEELILFGGEFFNGQKVCVYNDLYIYNITKNEWKQVRSPCGPPPRSGHQMVSIATDGGQLWLFGGEHASPSQLQFYHYKDLWVMSLKTRKWEKITAANGPSARSGHRMVAAKKRLIVFGGFHDNNQSYHYYNDVHMFCLQTYAWLKIEVTGAIVPQQRSGCCMAACPDGKILIWGGYSKSQVKKVDRGVTHTDMFALVPDKNSPNDKFKWNTTKASGYKPLPRSSVGCTSAPNGKVYCFGGVMDVDEDEEDVRGQFGDELLALDLSSQAWRTVEVAKKSKTSKTNTANDVEMNESKDVSKTPTVTSDGIFTVTVAGPSLSQPVPNMPSLFPNRPSKFEPSPRMNPGLCVCKGVLYVFGGIFEEDNKQFTYNDFYALDLHKANEWKVLIANDMNVHDWIDSDGSSSDTDDSEDEEDDDEDSEMETD
ncbi:kelch domain-containing protein 4-like [Teleopsis dalmanni]|uniref:kelch domain-containing protein 4-like n=1 Tax=Teleopsis dalmanni TaxID=139649 RepID=UPI000D32BF7E|nr:kelch domain-containing protein 4-like [Teleopsis dalmanni]